MSINRTATSSESMSLCAELASIHRLSTWNTLMFDTKKFESLASTSCICFLYWGADKRTSVPFNIPNEGKKIVGVKFVYEPCQMFPHQLKQHWDRLDLPFKEIENWMVLSLTDLCVVSL